MDIRSLKRVLNPSKCAKNVGNYGRDSSIGAKKNSARKVITPRSASAPTVGIRGDTLKYIARYKINHQLKLISFGYR